MLGGQHHLGLGEVRRRATQIRDQFEQALNGGENLQILLLAIQIILPAAVTLAVSEFMRKKQWIRFGDMKLEL